MSDKTIKHPLIMQGFDLAQVPIASIGISEKFDLEQGRGDVIGMDFLPDNEDIFTTYTGIVFNFSMGGQLLIKNANAQDFAGFDLNPNRLLPITVASKGGQTILGQITNNGLFTVGGQIAVFYDNPFDSSVFAFDVKMGNKLTLKRESFIFQIAAGAKETFKFTTARGYGNVIGLEIVQTLSIDEIQTRFTKFSLLMSGVEYFKDVSLSWFSKLVNRRQKRFPILAEPSSTNSIIVDNSLSPDPIELAVITYFEA